MLFAHRAVPEPQARRRDAPDLGGSTATVDQRLLRNLANAHDWFERIRAGETYDAIAASAGTSKRRVQQMIDLAFLAPDIVRAIVEGRQPAGLTSDWLKTTSIPSDWTRQRALSRALSGDHLHSRHVYRGNRRVDFGASSSGLGPIAGSRSSLGSRKPRKTRDYSRRSRIVGKWETAWSAVPEYVSNHVRVAPEPAFGACLKISENSRSLPDGMSATV